MSQSTRSKTPILRGNGESAILSQILEETSRSSINSPMPAQPPLPYRGISSGIASTASYAIPSPFEWEQAQKRERELTDRLSNLEKMFANITIPVPSQPVLGAVLPAIPTVSPTKPDLRDNVFGALHLIPNRLDSSPVVQFLKSLTQHCKTVITSPKVLNEWITKFYAFARLINMHEYYKGMIDFDLHPLCNPTWHKNQCRMDGSIFSMQVIKDNVAFLESTSLLHADSPSGNDMFTESKTMCYISQAQFEVVDYLNRSVGNSIKDMLELPLNHDYKQLVTGSDFDIDIMHPVSLFKSMYEYGNHNKKDIEIPKLCAELYTLKDCTLQQGIKHIEAVQFQLHRHGFTHFSTSQCDIQLLLLRLHPGPLNDMLQQVYRTNPMSWIPFKVMAEEIANSMISSRRSMYEHDLHKQQPTVPKSSVYTKPYITQPTLSESAQVKPITIVVPTYVAVNTKSTHTTKGVPIDDKYKPVPINSKYGPVKFTCLACQTDDPERHYWLQCTKLCNYAACIAQNKKPHWGNQCDNIASFNKAKREAGRLKASSATSTRNRFQAHSGSKDSDDDASVDSATPICKPTPTFHALIDSGANSIYVNDSSLITASIPTAANDNTSFVRVADGSLHRIKARGQFLNHKNVKELSHTVI